METRTEQEITERTMPQWDECLVTIATPKGPRQIRGLAHPWCPGLAVTMSGYGEFEVTHRATGRKLSGDYERCGSACLELAEWAAIARAAGIVWDDDTPEILAKKLEAVSEQHVPFAGATTTDKDGTRPMSIGRWMQMARHTVPLGEFPWESPDDHPLSKADEVLATLAPEKPARAD